MRLQLILLTSIACAAAKESLLDDASQSLQGRDTVPDKRAGALLPLTTTAIDAAPTRIYKGTEDAPIDGQDGKPHAGPFIDTTPEQTNAASSSSNGKSPALEKLASGKADIDGWKLKDIPEKNDGVMNDENRIVPDKKSTGTEGGVSEREKDRKNKGVMGNIPQEPKVAPPLPHSEQEHLDADKGKKGKTAATNGGQEKMSSGQEAKDKKSGEYGPGGLGLEKPADLPEKTHNNPHPEPNKGGKLSSAIDKIGFLNTGKPTSAGQAKGDWHEWVHSYVLSLTMILVSEIGDKTFLIAALMAMRHTRLLVFSAAFGALIAMTVLSAVLGHAVPTLLPKKWTTLAAAVLFLVFGIRMLREGLAMPKGLGVGEEMREVEAELEEKEQHTRHHRSDYNLESGRGRKNSHPNFDPSPPNSRSPSPIASRRPTSMAGFMNLLALVLSPAWIQTFIMTFLGEWGDRSQIATIAMAAGQDYWWVTLGAISGHACCTGIAVIGGKAMAGRVSLRVVTIGGAIAFLAFAAIYFVEELL